MLVAVIAAVGIWINLDSIAFGLTGSTESAAYAREYLQVIVLFLFILPLNNTLNDFATQEGFPQLTTRAVVTGSMANVVLDILFIGVLDMGISGAAWGTVTSGLINLALISPYFLRGKSQYILARPQLFLWCFGLQGSIDIALARRVFTCFGIYFFCFCVVSVYVTVVLQLAGHVRGPIGHLALHVYHECYNDSMG